jgi:hypothetical protein
VLYVNGKPRLFATPERAEFLRLLTAHLTRLGLTAVLGDAATAITTSDFRTERLAHGNDNAARIAEFDVLKVSSMSSWSSWEADSRGFLGVFGLLAHAGVLLL